jgi:hypothetical protein
MSSSRAKKKQRRRARAASATRTAPPPPPPPAAPAAPREATPRHPSRLEVRDGVARPDAIWAPFPLTEIGMGVGLVLFLIGFEGATAVLLAGVGVLVVVVAELCLREHFAGFRSHSVLLAMLAVTTLHVAVVAIGHVTWRGPPALVLDLAVAAALAWWLRGRFASAQSRARVRAT